MQRRLQLLSRLCSSSLTRPPPAVDAPGVPAASAVRLLASFAGSGAGGGAAGQRPGLFGIPGLHSPHDFLRMSAACKQRSQGLVEAILAAPPDASVVQLMDDLSDELCRCV